MFIDEIQVFARAGHGGKGCVAFLRETFRPKGGPSGGNGGRGGDVILEADHDLNNLIAQLYQPRLLAQHGQPGLGKGMDGRAGRDLLVKVPCGTLVWKRRAPNLAPHLHPAGPAPAQPGTEADAEPGTPAPALARPRWRRAGGVQAMEFDLARGDAEVSSGRLVDLEKGEQVADLTLHGQRFVLCRGGRGGLGNRNFATAVRQTPRFAQPGEPGEEGHFLLELRLMADVGLVGYPNAGKSTLLAAVSRARPKIAPYPFTTLHPEIGILEYPDHHRLTVCDVPGLIEGAHRNVGLGHAFLRHLRRCKILVLLLDMAGTDGRQPWHDYRQLLRELGLYDESLLAKPRLVAANKMDEPAAGGNLRQFKRRIRRTPVVPLAAAFDQGVDALKTALRTAVETAEA
ncbi:MAG: GTPase ObgE [Verrucomicrobia bacterium]|nr:GTPase ObgE [Verrucomicrobiota bacterium]